MRGTFNSDPRPRAGCVRVAYPLFENGHRGVILLVGGGAASCAGFLRANGYLVRVAGDQPLSQLVLQAHMSDISRGKILGIILDIGGTSADRMRLRIASAAVSAGVPTIVFGWTEFENSRYWTQFTDTAFYTVSHACAYGEPGRRPIFTYAWHIDPLDLNRLGRRCQPGRQCMYGRSHRQLSSPDRYVFPRRWRAALGFTLLCPIRARFLMV